MKTAWPFVTPGFEAQREHLHAPASVDNTLPTQGLTRLCATTHAMLSSHAACHIRHLQLA